MKSPLFRSLLLPCLLAACSSSGGGPSADAPSEPRDTTSPVADCVSSAGRVCTLGDAAVTTPDVADAAAKGTDAADSPPLAPEAPVARTDTTSADTANTTSPDTADTTSPDTKLPDAAVRKEDAAVPDAFTPDATLAKTDTLPDTSTPRADAAGPDSATCAQEPFVHLTPLELKTLLDGGEDPFLINVKGSSIKNLPGTDAVLANDVPGIEALVKNNVCANIILYCRSGATSQSVGSQLIAKGYRRVRDLAGGIIAWEAAGYPTE
jgi:phage shock protein E